MATVTKDFKVKNGLIVEGTTGTINNHDILTKKTDDQNYIIGLIGGSSDSANTPNTVVKRDGSGNFAAGVVTADLVGDVTGNADTATTLETARTIELTGDVTGQVNFNGSQNVQISTTLNGSFATDVEVATAKSEAISDANDYTDTRETAITTAYQSYADQAETDAIASANSYTDGRETAITTAYQTYVGGAVEDHSDLTSGVHGVTGDVVGTTDSQTLSNKTLGTDLAAGGYKVSGLATPTANADAATKLYVDTAVADLVNGAPALLDTLNELAAALGDDSDFITTVNAAIGEKVAKAGDSMTGNLDFGGTNKVTSLAAPTSNGDAANKLYVDTAESDAVTAANSYTDGRETAITTAYESYADQAESDAITSANSYTDGEISSLDGVAQGYAIAAELNAQTFTTNAINALTTSDIEEGTNLYYTNARAKAEAATLLANATKTNIIITKDGSDNLTITAENGVADSDTDDLTEGTTNLYFTDARAVSALEAVVPNFTEIEVNSVAKQVAATNLVPTASTVTAFDWSKDDYRTAKFLVKTAYGSHTDVAEVILTLDTSDNIAITEYAMVGTNGSAMTISADISASLVRLRVATVNNNSTVTVVGTLLK